MMQIVIEMMLVATVAQTSAPAAGELTADQKGYIAYDQCLLHAAMRASYTDAKDAEIYDLAKAACAATRAQAVIGQDQNRDLLAALKADDAEKAAHFPSWIKGVRERRRAFESGAPAAPPKS